MAACRSIGCVLSATHCAPNLNRRIGMWHKCTTDDEYDGHLIPKGTIVLGNAWRVLF
jgi:hypothetical protein